MIIESKDNNLIKQIRKLKEKKYRDEENRYIVEGIKIINEAICEKAKIEYIIVTEEFELTNLEVTNISEIEIIKVTNEVFKTLTNLTNSQGILAVIEKNISNEIIEEDLILVLDKIQDPGNLGTIIRTLDSTSLKQIVLIKGSVDPYNYKVIQSTMGAIFRVQIVEIDNIEKINSLKEKGYKATITSLETERTIYDIDYTKTILVMGNEANGVSKEVIDVADEKVKIPMKGKTESLNVAISTGIILYEYMRRLI